jgi:hypothetical protein
MQVPASLVGGRGARIFYGGQLDLDRTLTKWAGLTGKAEAEIETSRKKWISTYEADPNPVSRNKALEEAERADRMVRTGSFC